MVSGSKYGIDHPPAGIRRRCPPSDRPAAARQPVEEMKSLTTMRIVDPFPVALCGY